MWKTRTMNVFWSLEEHPFRTMILVETGRNTGMRGRRIARLHSQAVKMVCDLIVALDILALASRPMVPSSGGLWSWSHSHLLHWWDTGIIAAVDSLEGKLIHSSLRIFVWRIFHICSTIRLPGDTRPAYGGDTGIVSTLASVPWFLIGLAGIAWEYVSSSLESASQGFRTRRGYRDLPVDEDAQILHFEDEE